MYNYILLLGFTIRSDDRLSVVQGTEKGGSALFNNGGTTEIQSAAVGQPLRRSPVCILNNIGDRYNSTAQLLCCSEDVSLQYVRSLKINTEVL